ncbi:hypothetical protein LshimejAT787_0109860 [Lyophyllum shimeji]|uniref:Uncharacterized protein n=1 Tax=Lyophyllum shimeji TaxID=47721 RepID=A0A9P3PDW9_LYOSH|nr:hypothetical protein LshimejAT787_0109860 [Lyophyllum shimeji]
MLAGGVNETPRPRPPAKIRRSSALHAASPPPSYAAALTPEGKPRLNVTLLGSPMSATFQRVAWGSAAAERRMSPPPEDLEWMNERSREELSELLVKADDLIRARESELSKATAVCKSLYDNNVALKSKHQQLLARLPSSRTPSPSPSPSPEPLSRTSSRYSISLSRPISEYDNSPVASTYKSHARKISVSTSEISLLADQNAELLQKLERMESESLSADQSGRRALKRLEKEIAILREELEKTQAKSEELEQKAKAGWDSEKIVKEVLRKKDEREAKFKAMRNLGHGKTEDKDEEAEPEIRDFAPEGSVFGGPSTAFSFFPPGDTPRRQSGTPFRRPNPAPFTPHPESTLIAQLLEKIQELEETNNRIIDQQNETANQLNAMQRETEHINKVYECFADANIVEEACDDDAAPERGETATRDDTIRFRSFKRNLAGDFSPSPNPNDMHQSLNISTAPKTRKSVVGLFDNAKDDNRGPSTPDQLKSFSLPVPFASPSENEGRRKSVSAGSTGFFSPALSTLSLSPSQTSSQNLPQRTLETELGNEFTGGWGLNTGNNHSRANSLYDLTQTSAPASPSPLFAHPSLDQSKNIGSPLDSREMLPTPVSMTMGKSALRLSVEPPTPDKVAAASKDQGETPSKQSARYHRMTETVRSRTSRWVDGRFKDTLTGGTKANADVSADDEDRDGREVSRPSTPLPLRLANAFDAAVENFTGQPKRSSSQASAKSTEKKAPEKKRRGVGAVMLELWLWLQFAVIILVFLWAMAKRGPKSVLGEPGRTHRRTVSSASSR